MNSCRIELRENPSFAAWEKACLSDMNRRYVVGSQIEFKVWWGLFIPNLIERFNHE
jgi:hypothetical protein